MVPSNIKEQPLGRETEGGDSWPLHYIHGSSVMNETSRDQLRKLGMLMRSYFQRGTWLAQPSNSMSMFLWHVQSTHTPLSIRANDHHSLTWKCVWGELLLTSPIIPFMSRHEVVRCLLNSDYSLHIPMIFHPYQHLCCSHFTFWSFIPSFFCPIHEWTSKPLKIFPVYSQKSTQKNGLTFPSFGFWVSLPHLDICAQAIHGAQSILTQAAEGLGCQLPYRAFRVLPRIFDPRKVEEKGWEVHQDQWEIVDFTGFQWISPCKLANRPTFFGDFSCNQPSLLDLASPIHVKFP